MRAAQQVDLYKLKKSSAYAKVKENTCNMKIF